MVNFISRSTVVSLDNFGNPLSKTIKVKMMGEEISISSRNKLKKIKMQIKQKRKHVFS